MAALFRLIHIVQAFLQELSELEFSGERARHVLRTIASVLLAVTLSSILRLDDPVWSAISGYIVMKEDFRATVSRGAMRVLGTVGGALTGFFIARFVTENIVLLLTGLFIFGWIGSIQTHLSKYHYAWLFFAATASAVILYPLSFPEDTFNFMVTRIAEVTTGTVACIIVSALTHQMGETKAVKDGAPAGRNPLKRLVDEQWLRQNWQMMEHASRVGVVFALQPLVWRWLELTDSIQTAITALVVMIIPEADIRDGNNEAITHRILHRTLGCLSGSLIGILFLSLWGNDFTATLLTLALGIAIGGQIEKGRHGISYLGTQFVIGFLLTYVQGPAPAQSIVPGLLRFVSIVIGSLTAYIVVRLWPLRKINTP